MNKKAMAKALAATTGIVSCFGLFFFVLSRYPMVVLSTIMGAIFMGGFAILLVAYYDKYNK